MENLTNKLAAININNNNNERKKTNIKLRKKVIDFTVDNMPYKVDILSRAAKVTGKYKNSFNIK